jgi:multiple sugar transport system permease protein
VLVLGALFPFYWAVVASLTPERDLFRKPSLFPAEVVAEHYRALFDERDFWVPIRNSLIVAGTTTLLCVSLGSLCAYAIARLQFTGKEAVLAFILAVTMFPQISIVSPLYLLLRSLGLINTYPGLVLPYLTFAMPLTVWLLVGFFRQLPRSLEEAALVDGCTRWTSFWRVAAPLAVPGIVAAAIFTFIACWTEFFFALVLTSRNAYTLPTVFRAFLSFQGAQYGAASALSIVSLVPSIVLGVLVQKHLVRGLTLGAIRG